MHIFVKNKKDYKNKIIMEKRKQPIFFWILAGVILTLAIIFSVQNFTYVPVKFISFEIRGPLFMVIVLTFFLGFLLGRIWSIIAGKRKSKAIKKEEKAEEA